MNISLYNNRYIKSGICLAMVCSVVLLFSTKTFAQRRGSQSLAVKLMQLVNQRSNVRVLSAFEEVVDKPAESTVELIREDKRIAMGTVVQSDGFILTKASQIDDVRLQGTTPPLICRLPNGDEYEADIVSIEKEHDLALLKIDARRLKVIKFTEKEEPMVGSILASPSIGDEPLGIGIMSAESRKIKQSRPMIGVQLSQRSPVTGARVESVVKDSAADKAKLEVADVILQIDNKKIESSGKLISTVQQYRPGDIIKLLVQRGENQINLLCTLGEYTNGPNQARHQFQNHLGGQLSHRRSGFPMVLQHDTFLKPEDCGGPLVDLDGNAIGINIARAGRVASYAIPAKVLPELITKLISDGESREVSTTSK